MFVIPIKDMNVARVLDPSLNGFRMNDKLFRSLMSQLDDAHDCRYFLLKGIEENSVELNFPALENLLTQKAQSTSSSETFLDALLGAFNFEGTSCEKYLSIAQFPLGVFKTEEQKLLVQRPRNIWDIFNHCFLHFYQFLVLKGHKIERSKIDALIKLSDRRYQPGIHCSAKSVSCCLNNLLIEVPSRKIFLYQHDCHRSQQAKERFDSNLYRVVSNLLA